MASTAYETVGAVTLAACCRWLAAPESPGAQHSRDWLAGLQGIDAQQFIERAIISGPKQPPNAAKRRAQSNRMDFAFVIRTHDSTIRALPRCDVCHR